MTGDLSKTSPSLTMGGFLSTDCAENALFCKANMIFYHYCSSDQWSGDIAADSTNKWHFRGKNIILEILRQVVTKYPAIRKASRITLSGDSAGGMGVQNNGDRVGDLLYSLIGQGKFEYRMLPDSGWFLTGPSFHELPCVDTTLCNL